MAYPPSPVAGTDANPANDTDQETTTVRVPPPPGSRVIDGFGGAGALLTQRGKRFLEARIDAGPVGPGDERRDSPWWVLARVRALGCAR